MEKVLDYIRKNGMLKEGDRVIAGVSGGADSICLLFWLDRYREALGISVEVVHMEHGIRGKESLEVSAANPIIRKKAIAAGRPNTPMASNTFGSEMNTRLGPEAIPSFPRKTKTAGMIIIPARKATPVSKISI